MAAALAVVAEQGKPPDKIGGFKPPIPIKTFAEILNGGSKKLSIEIKTPTTYKGEPAIFFSEEEVNILAEPFKHALIGRFPRGRPNMESIRNFFAKLSLKADFKIGLLDSKHILIHLQHEEDFHRIWLRSQWNIWQYPMIISKWHVNFTPDTESPIVPVWVSLPYLPPHLFKHEALMSIAKVMGTPMRIDASTATISRPSKARVCVETDVSKQLPKRAWIGQGSSGFWQQFAYEEVPMYCSVCSKLGHENNRCIMAENKEESKELPKENAQNKAPQKQNNNALEVQNKGPPKHAQNKAKDNKQIYIEKKKAEAIGKEKVTERKEDIPSTSGIEEQQHLGNQEKSRVSVQNKFTALEIEEIQDEEEIEEIHKEEEPVKSIETPKQAKSRKWSHNSMPRMDPALQHLLKDTESFSQNFRKKCSLSMNLTDIDKPRDSNNPTIQELKDFIASMPKFKITSTMNEDGQITLEDGQTNEDIDKTETEQDNSSQQNVSEEEYVDKGVQRKKNYPKNPEHQRKLRSSMVKPPQTSNTCNSNV